MTPRRILAAAVLGLLGTSVLLAPTASAVGPGAVAQTSTGRVACAWVLDEGVCVSNPLPKLPSLPDLP